MLLLFKNLAFTVLVPGSVAVYLPRMLARGEAVDSPLALAASIAAFTLGGAVYAWCLWDFAIHGRGTPAPIDAPKQLVLRGLYRCVRNPMYVGVLTVILGWVIRFQEGRLAAYGLTVAICFHLFIVLYEEPHLTRLFGAQYEEYRGTVGRWLPRPPRNAGS